MSSERNTRAIQAQETVKACDVGYYHVGGRRVEIAGMVAAAREGTVLYSNVPAATAAARPRPTHLSVVNETTFSALRRLSGKNGHVACLNFASAKNPGGGFLGGAQAQEEALARASALYPCLLMAPDYYERNRANRSALYLDLAIFSPRVPFFRDDRGAFLEQPVLASVVTAPAPNAGAVAQNEPRNSPLVEPALRRRAEFVLSIAQVQNVDHLVLGAWGCGVFRNDPRVVARIFRDQLTGPGRFASSFESVVFAVFDRGEPPQTYQAFSSVLEGS